MRRTVAARLFLALLAALVGGCTFHHTVPIRYTPLIQTQRLADPDTPQNLVANQWDWTATNAFTVTWENPLDTPGIVGAYVRIGDPPAFFTDGTFFAGEELTQISGITVTGPGTHPAHLWLEDGAGNADPPYLAAQAYDAGAPREVALVERRLLAGSRGCAFVRLAGVTVSGRRCGGDDADCISPGGEGVKTLVARGGTDQDWQTVPPLQFGRNGLVGAREGNPEAGGIVQLARP